MANPVTHLEKTIAGEVQPVTHLEKVIAEYGGGNVYESLEAGTNIFIEETSDGKAKISASGEISSEDTVARADIAAIKDGETLDSFGDVETALDDKADSTTTYTKTEVDTALSAKANSIDVYSKTAVDTALGNKADKSTTYTKTEVDTSLGNKADKSTTYTKTEVNTALGNKVDKVSGKGLSTNDYTTAEKTKLAGIAEGAEVNEIEGIKVNNTTINPDANKVVNITVPTTAADVSALPASTKYAAALSLTINSSTFVMTGQLKDQNGNNLGTAQTIDLPLESVVVGGSYNSQTKKVVLTLQNGNTIEFSVADLVSGLQTELSASNKLNPAYINYDSTHRAVSDTEKSTWNGKQNAIDSSHKLSADLVDDTSTTNKFATAAELEQIETNKNNISTLESMNGAKNFAQLTYTGSTVNNVTYTVSNGIITADGNTTNASTTIVITGEISLPAGNYVLLDGLTTSSAQINLTLRINNVWKGTTATGGKYEFTVVQGDTAHIELIVANNTSTAGVVFKPMIITKTAYDAGFTDFQPYAMSNAELTAAIQALQAQLANQ